MFFGEKNIFSIEADFHQGENHLFISYCFWLNEDKIGDKEQISLLENALDNVKHNLEMRGHRCIEDMHSLNYKDIFNYLNYTLWGIGNSNLEIKTRKKISNLSVIKDYGECFDGYYCYLLEFKTHDLLIWNNEYNEIMEYNIPKNLFYRSFEEMDRWIKQNTKLVLLDSERVDGVRFD